MDRSWKRFDWTATEVPQAPLDHRQRLRAGVPLTLRAVQDARAVQRPVFDPALQQYPNAYRAADPHFPDAGVEARWLEARRRATDLVLAAVADSPWAEHLVLRGSRLLRAWFGDAAREPGDLDFVVVPREWRIEEPRTTGLFEGIARAAGHVSASGPVRISAADAVAEDIWTYDRVPGRRLVLPWTADGLPGGIVQLDVVFNERLPTPPERFPLPALSADGPQAAVLGVSPELSLAWKLMWLVSDRHPQGKDLYDAVLLAESCRLRPEVLRDVFLDAEGWYALHPVTADALGDLVPEVEWRHFAAEYPRLGGDATAYGRRLTTALAPTFDAAPQGAALRAWWMAPWLAEYRGVHDREGMAGLQKRLAAEVGPPVAVVITRQVLGPGRCSPEDALAIMLADPAWSQWVEIYERHPKWRREHLSEPGE
ncbi:nucleotidyl transferase AbiEii/AbiGii toxin family protein [Streptomyces sp. PA03-1a]|nr:nucleotidyl transferase AbiEii/AbiGii toxin family protein [Streptomyces sp. PA03-1a]MDX2812931.1 nucleotidyl transferase AbiEii/AbiGii toxin family protein [Streptomyces sp. PA03-5A]